MPQRSGQRQRRYDVIRGQPDQKQLFQPQAANDDSLRRSGDSNRLILRSGVRSDHRRTFKHGPSQSFDFRPRKHGKARLSASAAARLDLRVNDVENTMQHALLNADFLDAFEKNAALFALEDALLRDQFVAFNPVAE